jgi:hypothetical protein
MKSVVTRWFLPLDLAFDRILAREKCFLISYLMVPQEGFEPPTPSLRMMCATGGSRRGDRASHPTTSRRASGPTCRPIPSAGFLGWRKAWGASTIAFAMSRRSGAGSLWINFPRHRTTWRGETGPASRWPLLRHLFRPTFLAEREAERKFRSVRELLVAGSAMGPLKKTAFEISKPLSTKSLADMPHLVGAAGLEPATR